MLTCQTLRWEFETALGAVLAETYRRGGTIAIADAHELAWQTAAAPSPRSDHSTRR